MTHLAMQQLIKHFIHFEKIGGGGDASSAHQNLGNKYTLWIQQTALQCMTF